MDCIKVLSLDSGIRKTWVLISTPVCSKLLQLCPTLCDPMDHIPPGSSVYGILQARIRKWVAFPPRDLPHPGMEPESLMSAALAGRFYP